jgi:hypothetical protein
MTEYVLTYPAIRTAINDLDSRRIHPHFAAYLGLTRYAEQEGRTQDLEYDYADYIDENYRVRGTETTNMVVDGSEKWYLTPFTNPRSGDKWKAENWNQQVSPNTTRRGWSNVVEMDEDDGTITLKDDHWELAREHLTDGEQVPAVCVSIYLYRDYGFESDEEPELSDVIEIFREEYGFEDDNKFEYLFTEDYDLGVDDPFEEVDND